MSENDVKPLIVLMNEVRELVQVVDSKLATHLVLHEERDAWRKQTCPQSERILENRSDVNALAGKLRYHEKKQDAMTDDEKFWSRATAKQLLTTTGAVIAGVLIAKLVGA